MKTTELENLKQTSVLLQTTGAEAVIQSLKAEGVKTIFCHVLKKVYTFYINTKIRLQFKYNSKIYLQPPFFCNNFSIYNLPF